MFVIDYKDAYLGLEVFGLVTGTEVLGMEPVAREWDCDMHAWEGLKDL